ncbi:hypothetical protein LXL04_017375 [Taraxacum kok-saghyz]
MEASKATFSGRLFVFPFNRSGLVTIVLLILFIRFPIQIDKFNRSLYLGVIYKDRDNLDKAVECYQLALSIKTNFSRSLNNLGVVYTVQGKMDAAASMIEKAIVANPTYAEAYNNLGVLYRDAGSISLAIEAYEQCVKIDPDSCNAGQNRLLAMNYINEGTDEKLYEAHRDWGRRFMRLYPQYTTCENSKDPERPLVIGYVSPDYFTHSVSYFIEAPLIYHDYGKFKVVVYSAVVKIGYPNTTGLPTIDYRITDSLADPIDTKQNVLVFVIAKRTCDIKRMSRLKMQEPHVTGTKSFVRLAEEEVPDNLSMVPNNSPLGNRRSSSESHHNNGTSS